VDGVRAYQSPVMRGTTAARFVRVDLTGRQQLRLVVTAGGTVDHLLLGHVSVETAERYGGKRTTIPSLAKFLNFG